MWYPYVVLAAVTQLNSWSAGCGQKTTHQPGPCCRYAALYLSRITDKNGGIPLETKSNSTAAADL